jgi:hypothetical protein
VAALYVMTCNMIDLGIGHDRLRTAQQQLPEHAPRMQDMQLTAVERYNCRRSAQDVAA